MVEREKAENVESAWGLGMGTDARYFACLRSGCVFRHVWELPARECGGSSPGPPCLPASTRALTPAPYFLEV